MFSTWHQAEREPFGDPSIPKLANLARARRAGFRVPPTAWAWASELEQERARSGPIERPGPLPCIVRSGSPTEDTGATSNAGQFRSVVVRTAAEFPGALAEVLDAMPVRAGRRRGVVFVQPLIEAEVAGVTFFDGFYYEETSAAGGNAALTGGRERGKLRRGYLRRLDPHSDWLERLHRTFGGRLDIEWAEPVAGGPRIVLQVRPALFPIRRNELLSLANHKEIVGDVPSPWMLGVLTGLDRPILGLVGRAEPAARAWDEPYAVELAGRAWINLSGLFRVADALGLPRTLVTHGIGGADDGPRDARLLGRIGWKWPRVLGMGLINFAEMARIGRRLRELDAAIEAAGTLAELHAVNVRAMEFSVRTNFAILANLAVIGAVRRALGLRQAARVVTHAMMTQFAAIARLPDPVARLARLDQWLDRFGHRGPFETDPWRPRFAELREPLRAALLRGPGPELPRRAQPSALGAVLARPLFLIDELRERFRDQLMRRWQAIRARVLAEGRRAVDAGHLDAPDDAFFLRAAELAAAPETWRHQVLMNRAARESASALDLPTTAPRDTLDALIARTEPAEPAPSADRFRGVGLGSAAVQGTAVRATRLEDLLDGQPLPESPILVAETLEPSWAVVFPRFAAVVADLGGELSHAAILLREAGVPAVVNAQGAARRIKTGDSIRVDPRRGEVLVQTDAPPQSTPAGREPTWPRATILNKAC